MNCHSMPFHRLPDDLYTHILKLAANMWVEDYGPSDGECLYGYEALEGVTHPCRVSEALGLVHPPDLVCEFCRRVCIGRLSRTDCGMVEWRSVCEVCDREA